MSGRPLRVEPAPALSVLAPYTTSRPEHGIDLVLDFNESLAPPIALARDETTRSLAVNRYPTQHRLEHVIADLKAGPLTHLPSGRFTANAAWLVAATIAHTLTRAVGVLAGAGYILQERVDNMVFFSPQQIAGFIVFCMLLGLIGAWRFGAASRNLRPPYLT